MLPDTGERYLSTPLFQDVLEEMSPEEIEISQSTPSARFDVAPPPPPDDEEQEEAQTLSQEAVDFMEKTIADTAQPVTMFALEWCEFCWSVRKLFARCGIEYRSVDLDSADYQAGDWGGQIRAALTARTGIKTIPQIFVGGELVGGCTEAFDAFNEGRLQSLLKQSGAAFDESVALDPYTLLPTWLHPR
jgi:cysteine synthase A